MKSQPVLGSLGVTAKRLCLGREVGSTRSPQHADYPRSRRPSQMYKTFLKRSAMINGNHRYSALVIDAIGGEYYQALAEIS